MKVKSVKDDKELDMCLLEEHEERVKRIDADMQVVKRDMVLVGDCKSLAERAASLEEAYFEIRVAINRRLKSRLKSRLKRLCMDCLRTVYIGKKCRAPSMCKKCTRHHHTLLLMDADNLTKKKPDNAEAREEAHIAALSVSEQLLLMTCNVKDTAPDGSSTIAS